MKKYVIINQTFQFVNEGMKESDLVGIPLAVLSFFLLLVLDAFLNFWNLDFNEKVYVCSVLFFMFYPITFMTTAAVLSIPEFFYRFFKHTVFKLEETNESNN